MSPELLLAALIVAAIPGTGVYTLACGLSRGPLAAMAAALGCSAAVLVHVAAALAGLAAALHASAALFQAVKFAGAAFLLWMAWQTLREAGALAGSGPVGDRSLARIAWRGVALNLLNPKLAIFFAAFLPQFVNPQVPGAGARMLLLGLAFAAITAGGGAACGLCAGLARDRILTSEPALRWLRRGFAACFAVLGLKLALQER